MAIINSEQVEVFNKQLSDKKASDPLLGSAPLEALDIAIGQARREVIPRSFGAAMFEIPEGKDPDQYINLITDNIVSTAVENFKYLSYQSPQYLSGWIQNRPSFKDSKAYTDLKTITKTEFDTIENGISDMEMGESPDFRNKDLNKISSHNLQQVLDSTVLGFLKEIGIQRDPRSAPSDGYILEGAKEVFDFLTKSLVPPPPKPEPEQPAPAVITTTPSQTPVEAAESAQTPEAAPPAEIPATVTTAQQEIVKPETPEPTNTQPPPAETPTVVQQAQTNVTNITNQNNVTSSETKTFGAATTREFTRQESPLLSMLGEQLGMSAGEIANIFAGGDIATFDQAISQSFLDGGGGESDITQQAGEILQNPDLASKAATVVQTLTQNENIPPAIKEKVANVVSQTTGITEQAPQTTPESQSTPAPPAPQSETPEKTEAQNEKPTEEKSQEEKNKDAAESETKADEESKREEQLQTNLELLRVMKQILTTLQGPLIVTDNTHKYS